MQRRHSPRPVSGFSSATITRALGDEGAGDGLAAAWADPLAGAGDNRDLGPPDGPSCGGGGDGGRAPLRKANLVSLAHDEMHRRITLG